MKPLYSFPIKIQYNQFQDNEKSFVSISWRLYFICKCLYTSHKDIHARHEDLWSYTMTADLELHKSHKVQGYECYVIAMFSILRSFVTSKLNFSHIKN